MKILLVYLKNDTEILNQIKQILDEMKIETLLFSPKSRKDMDICKFIELFETGSMDNDSENENAPGYMLILSSIPGNWFDFLAGFSSGYRLPLIVFGQENIAGISQEFASCFTFINNDASLKTYFEYELEAFKKQEAARGIIKAQNSLLKMGVPVTGESLAQCVIEGRIQEISLFLAAGFSPDTRNKMGVPLLNIAARNGMREVIRFLLMANADVNIISEDRRTSALIDSVMAKKYDLMMDLIKAGADLDIQSRDGQTALVVAVGTGEEKTVESLLKAGSDPDIADSMGMSARKYAELFNKDKLSKFFDELAPVKTG